MATSQTSGGVHKDVKLMDYANMAAPGDIAKTVAAPVIGLVRKIHRFSIIDKDQRRTVIAESPEDSG